MRLLLDTCILYDWMMDALSDPETVALIQQTGIMPSAAFAPSSVKSKPSNRPSG
jgi:hypothetical protein